MKKTLLTIIAALLLGGVVNAQDWGETDSHAKSSNTPIVASVTLDGNAVTPTADYRLGAFVGEELRGLAAPHTDNNFWIQVFYNQGTTETISFKLYDGNNEYTTCSVTQTTQEKGWGTPTNPVVLDFATTQTMTQTTAFSQGWNWWSTPVEMIGVNGLTMLENGLGANGMTINSVSGNFVEYVPDWEMWWGIDFSVVNEEMYEIEASNSTQVQLSGITADPSAHPITISQGWNWIGYISNSTMSVETALSSLNPSEDDIIQSWDNGYSLYWPGFGFWGELQNMEPGHGYKYYANGTTQTLTYPTIANRETRSEIRTVSKPKTESLSHRYLMAVVATIEMDGEEIASDSYDLIAVSDGQIRGKAELRYCEPNGRYIALLTVYGDSNEDLNFVVINKQNDITYFADNKIVFSSQSVLGSLKSPFAIHIGNNQACNIFPNPVKVGAEVYLNIGNESLINTNAKIELINEMGEIVSIVSPNTNPLLAVAPNNAGVYIVRVYNDGKVYFGKLIVIQ